MFVCRLLLGVAFILVATHVSENHGRTPHHVYFHFSMLRSLLTRGSFRIATSARIQSRLTLFQTESYFTPRPTWHAIPMARQGWLVSDQLKNLRAFCAA